MHADLESELNPHIALPLIFLHKASHTTRALSLAAVVDAFRMRAWRWSPPWLLPSPPLPTSHSCAPLARPPPPFSSPARSTSKDAQIQRKKKKKKREKAKEVEEKDTARWHPSSSIYSSAASPSTVLVRVGAVGGGGGASSGVTGVCAYDAVAARLPPVSVATRRATTSARPRQGGVAGRREREGE